MTQQAFQWAKIGPTTLRAPLVGRAEEMRVLSSALETVERTKSPRVVTVRGPGGVGKSRLVYEFLVHAQAERDEGAVLRTYRGTARDGLGGTYALFARLLRARFGLLESTDPEVARQQIRSQLSQVLDDRKVGDVAYFLGQLLELPFQDSPLVRAVADDLQQARLVRQAVLKRFFESDAAQSPLVLVFEDVQDAHADALELLAYLVTNLQGPVLFVIVGRPELVTREGNLTHLRPDAHDAMELGPLPDAEAATVVELLLAPTGSPPASLVEAACALAGGNPSLLERMVRIFHDTRVLEEAQDDEGNVVWNVHEERIPDAHLPLTVADAVEARIVGLIPSERRVLEQAATMGGVFWLGGLVALARIDAVAPERWPTTTPDDTLRLREILRDLVERDYVLKLPDSTFSGDEEYVFKHNKERERAAKIISKEDARRFHHVIADWLEQKSQIDQQEEIHAMLGKHRELASDHTRAGMAFILAGHAARDRYAYQKAIEWYAKGLQLLGDHDVRTRLDALHHFGDVLLSAGRTDEALARFREMLTLAYRLDLTAKGGAAHNRIGRLHRDTGTLDEAAKHLATGLALFEMADDQRGIASSLDDIGKLRWMKGDYVSALDELRRALAMRRKLGDRRGIALSLNNVGLVLQDSGKFEEAIEAFEQSLAIRREIGDLVGVVMSLNNLGTVVQDVGDHARALALYRDAYAIAKEVSDKNRVSLVMINIGEALYRLGRTQEAIDLLHQAEEMCDELGDRIGMAEVNRGLGKAYMLSGDLAKARSAISKSVDLFTAVRSKVHLAIALRTLGEVTAAGGWGPDHRRKARDYFRRVIAIFEEIGNDVELARTFRTWADLVKSIPELAKDPDVTREAEQMRQRADNIFARLRAPSAIEIDVDG